MIPPDIHNSTADERRNYVLLQWECQNNCEACGRCKILKGMDAETLYADYIDGNRSYIDINFLSNICRIDPTEHIGPPILII